MGRTRPGLKQAPRKRKRKQRILRWVAVALIAVLALMEAAVAFGADAPEDMRNLTRLVDPAGNELLTTGLMLSRGDRFIDAENVDWLVERVDAGIAHARARGQLSPRLTDAELKGIAPWFPLQSMDLAQDPVDVVIYHSHSDESYIPGDGADSIDGRGGIYRVGAALADALADEGVSVYQSQANHNPRNAGSYVRSRRTALDALAKRNPAVMFDIHRDAAPASQYLFNIDGETVSKIMIVIGRNNPTHESNLAFARVLKTAVDADNPGLIRGIYVGQGNYNQDIYGRNLILEVGSQGVPRAAAEAGAALMSTGIASLLDVRPGGQGVPQLRPEESQAAGRSIGWILAFLIALAAGGWILTQGRARPVLAGRARHVTAQLERYLNHPEVRRRRDQFTRYLRRFKPPR